MDRNYSVPETIPFQIILDNRTEGASALLEQFVQQARDQPLEVIIAGLNACHQTFPLMAVWPYLRHQLTGNRLNLEQIAEAMTIQTRNVIAKAAEILTGNEVLLTLSNSSLVRRTILALDPKPAVLCAASEPGSEGRLLASAFSEAGVQTTLVEDDQLSANIGNTHAVLLGADMYDDTAFINKVGSDDLARRARQCGKQVLVLAEEFKRVPQLPELTPELTTLAISSRGKTTTHVIFEQVLWQPHIRLITNKP
ncbi:MAG: hypothetical protein JSU61_13315 [Fidelibacterota bacterium]|nr:MAG: hypothetical protein JSU61_13315 [Candidatus Neomarinimicrobiota bacterium]